MEYKNVLEIKLEIIFWHILLINAIFRSDLKDLLLPLAHWQGSPLKLEKQ
jgi:hypothetical protein